MSATNFNTKNDTYRKLIGNGLTYRVPRFQRDYSWGEEEWEDLWQDILGTVKEGGEPAHYMGYLVLQSSDDKVFDIIDGQQRLTTISLIVLAALRQLKRQIEAGVDVENTNKRLEALRQTYIGYLDPVTLVSKPKLSLNRNNDTYYSTYIVPLEDILPQRKINVSELALRKAFEWFDKKIQDYVKGSDDAAEKVAQFVDRMSDKLFFTVIQVTDELNAYKVFETLNARGVRLSATDLLKNYFFSVLHSEKKHDHELQALDDRWEKIVNRLGAESFPDFLRLYWMSCKSFVRQSELFKVIRADVKKREDVFSLLRGLEGNMDTYLALVSPEESNWTLNAKQHVITLKMFGVRQPFPLLMAAKQKFSEGDFEAILRAIMVISLRYNVIGNLPPNEQERLYHACARKVAEGACATVKSILVELKTLYPSDDVFRTAFAEKSFNTKKSVRNRAIVKYIMLELERHCSMADWNGDSTRITIEHICPLHPEGTWANFSDENVDNYAHRLGNLTLLQESQNRELGNAEYEEKRQVFASSEFSITREIAEQHGEWTPKSIEARQKKLAKTATSLWRISQL